MPLSVFGGADNSKPTSARSLAAGRVVRRRQSPPLRVTQKVYFNDNCTFLGAYCVAEPLRMPSVVAV
jgi:hypothetical protein